MRTLIVFDVQDFTPPDSSHLKLINIHFNSTHLVIFLTDSRSNLSALKFKYYTSCKLYIMGYGSKDNVSAISRGYYTFVLR